MTDLATPEAPDVSTTLDPQAEPSPSGGGQPRTLGDEPKEPAKPASLRDTIADEVKKGDEGKDAKPAGEAKDDEAKKAEDEKKPAKADDGKAEKPAEVKDEKKPAEDGKLAAKEQQPGDPDAKADKPSGHIDPPKNFLPDAKETWRNTPRAVQRDVQNAIQQHEQEVTRYREAAERYEPIRQYDELVRENGRAGIHETLQEVAQLESMMQRNPVAALNQALMRAGPRKPDGQPYSFFEVAQAVVQKGQQGYQQMVAQHPRQQQPANENSEVAQLKQQLAQLQDQHVETSVIAPFKAAHPRYTELEGDIAFFLQSGKIPASLSLSDRLEAAYDMAVRINPASHAEQPSTPDSPDPGRRADDDLSGTKSIKSAPGAVSPEMEPNRGGSIRSLLEDQIKRQRRA